MQENVAYMKNFYIIYILIAMACLFLPACNNNNNTNVHVPSDDPTVATFSFTANDSFPALAKASFTIEERIDTGLIYNVDSLTYGTCIDKVIPKITFNASIVSAAIIYTPSDTVTLSGGDTINFSERPVMLLTISETGKVEKWYEIQVNVHQSDPDLYVWEQLTDHITEGTYNRQKAVILAGKLWFFASDGLGAKVFVSADGKSWQPFASPFDNFDVTNLLTHKDKIYCINDDKMAFLATGADTWQTVAATADTELQIEQLLFSFNDSLWAVVKDKNTDIYNLATRADETGDWVLHDTVSSDFPVSDCASLAFLSPTGRKRGMVVGGFSCTGKSLNTRWNVEYDSTEGYRWENFSVEQPWFSSLTGVSIIYYDRHFFMFGGVDEAGVINKYNILESYDEGMHWSPVDTAHNAMPASYIPRAYQSVAVDGNNYIYIIGGKSRTEVFTDVYRGKLNSIDW